MADKLEPCPTPWCDEAGGEPYVFTRRKDCFGVYCPSCSVATPYFPTREEAVEFWNTRPEAADEITRLNAENEELVGALEPFARGDHGIEDIRRARALICRVKGVKAATVPSAKVPRQTHG